MSLANTRLQVAAALDGIAGVTGHSKRPSTPAIGDGWSLMGPLDRANGTAFTATWRVRFMLPQDEDEASAWMDSHWPDIFYALSPHGFVQRAVPVMLAAGGGEFYALEVTMIGEE